MNTSSTRNRALAALLLVVIASASLASTALADSGHWRTKRGRAAGPVVVHRGPHFVERHSDAGAIVGFLGGLVVGSILSGTPAPSPAPAAYEYYDPFCRRNFITIEAYDRHLGYHRHPRSVEVIEMHGGRCVDTMDRRDGRWCSRGERPRYEDWND